MTASRSVYSSRRRSKVNAVWSIFALCFWTLLTIGAIASGVPALRIAGFVMAVLVAGSWISFARWLTRRSDELVIDAQAVAFRKVKLYYKDITAIEKGFTDIAKDAFEVRLTTAQAKHKLNLLEYNIAPEYAGSVFDELVGAHRSANQAANRSTLRRRAGGGIEDALDALENEYIPSLGKDSSP